MLHGRQAVGQRVPSLDQRLDGDAPLLQQSNRRAEGPTARSHECQFVDDHARRIQRETTGVGALHDQRTTRTQRSERARHPLRIPGALDRDVKGSMFDRIGRPRRDTARVQQLEFRGVTPDDEEVAPHHGQGLRDEVPELAVTDHEYTVPRSEFDLLLEFERRCKRFGKRRGISRDRLWYHVEIFGREREILRKRSIATFDPQHRARATVRRMASVAGIAVSARRIDLPNDPLSHQPGRPPGNAPHELMTEHAPVRVIATHELQIGVADSRLQHLNQRFTFRRIRYPDIVSQTETTVLEPDRSHQRAHEPRPGRQSKPLSGGTHSPFLSEPTGTWYRPGMKNKRSIVRIAIVFEGALVALAAVVGFFMGRSPWAALRLTWDGIGWGVLATLPLVVALAWGLNSSWPPFRRLIETVDEILTPMLSACTTGDIVIISVVAGVGEEILFRGLMQPILADALTPLLGLILTSGLFGLLHLVTPTYAILAAVIGAYLGLLVMVSGNLMPAIVAHALYDFVAIRQLVRMRPASENTEP